MGLTRAMIGNTLFYYCWRLLGVSVLLKDINLYEISTTDIGSGHIDIESFVSVRNV
jgi:hypothetical protein